MCALCVALPPRFVYMPVHSHNMLLLDMYELCLYGIICMHCARLHACFIDRDKAIAHGMHKNRCQ